MPKRFGLRPRVAGLTVLGLRFATALVLLPSALANVNGAAFTTDDPGFAASAGTVGIELAPRLREQLGARCGRTARWAIGTHFDHRAIRVGRRDDSRPEWNLIPFQPLQIAPTCTRKTGRCDPFFRGESTRGTSEKAAATTEISMSPWLQGINEGHGSRRLGFAAPTAKA